MVIEVMRIGQRVVRDDRVTTHVALVARAFGANTILMTEVNPDIKETLEKINNTWGGNFSIEFIDSWKPVLKMKKENGFKIVHLSMYGEKINEEANLILKSVL
jgi:tRNA (cytidine56-2'-O)-methyltransferase